MEPTAPTAKHEEPIANHGLPLYEHETNDETNLGGWKRAWNGFERQLVAYNLEARGIERVEPDERQDLRLLGYSQVAIMWFSVNLAANNITLGMLGPAVFSLGFVDACLLSVFGALVGCLVVAYIATFGPKSGNRTMIFSRCVAPPSPWVNLTSIGTSWAGGPPRLSSSSTLSSYWATR